MAVSTTWRLTPPSSGRPRASFAVSRLPLMSNVRFPKVRCTLLVVAVRLMLALLGATATLAWPQTTPMPPTFRVMGVYSPRANHAEYEAFLSREVAARNPIKFSAEPKAFLTRVGRAAEIVPLSKDELAEVREDLDRELSAAVLVEVLVESANKPFRVGEFTQPNPAVPPGSWQVAWCEKFLTPDGTALLEKPPFNKLPSEGQYRIAFYIHDWKQELGLTGPYGRLTVPQIEPMPSRLWKLAPYEQVD